MSLRDFIIALMAAGWTKEEATKEAVRVYRGEDGAERDAENIP
jgi:hypothetical protein